jgi:hypothetical protein
MDTANFDALTRTASRRGSLLALSGVGLAALTGSVGAAAKPKAGKVAKKKFKTRCKAQVGQCRTIFNIACETEQDPESCREIVLPCCDFLSSCNGAKMLECFLTLRQV